MSVSTDLNSYTSENILSGDNVLIYVGPARINPDEMGPVPEPGEDDTSVTYKIKLVGLVQGINFSTARPQRQVPELGSKAKYLVSSRGQKQMSMARLMTDHGNVLNAMYRAMTENVENVNKPKGKIWLALDHPLFRKPIGVMLRLIRYDDNGDPSELQRTYFCDATIASIGAQVNEGDRGIADNVSMLWAETIDLPRGGYNV